MSFKILDKDLQERKLAAWKEKCAERDKTTKEDLDSLKFIERFTRGMQVTLYMHPGREQNYTDLFKEIEAALQAQNIRPGIIDLSDRPIGIYHP